MLRKIRSQELEQETLELDDHIPFNAYWKTPFAFPIQYWRTGDLKESFIEIGINSESGELLSITLLLLPSVFNGSPTFLDGQKAIDQSGIPVFDMSAWEDIKYIEQFLVNLWGPSNKPRSYFNKEWLNKQMADAVQFAFDDAVKKGKTCDGKHVVEYLGEKITIYIGEGFPSTAYGPHRYTLKDFDY
ncbi:hypothetical protein [Brevibacillus sp. SKDU10]|uniref:hypothetical protein n=1 Tax=Brevibacillus sp. SKDU10 TaxID=1247872 RepID=UPI000ABA2E86|nr:hypothetical protein [Brevibacillus sp. SKDU10]